MATKKRAKRASAPTKPARVNKMDGKPTRMRKGLPDVPISPFAPPASIDDDRAQILARLADIRVPEFTRTLVDPPTDVMGRPTGYCAEIGERICALIAEGRFKGEVCTMLGIGVMTLWHWEQKYEDFRYKLARARVFAAEAFAYMAAKKLEGMDGAGKDDGPAVAAAAHAANHYRWMAQKSNPRQFGDRVEHVGEIDVVHRRASLRDKILATVIDGSTGKPIDSPGTEETAGLPDGR